MSDRDKGLRAADDEIPLANRAFCVEHISRNIQKNYGVPSRVAFNSHIRFSLTEGRVQTGFAKLRDISPQAAAYLDDIPLALWAIPYLLGKRYGHNTSNLVDVMNKWILQERRPSVLDLLHSLWSKCMDLRFRRLQEAQKCHDSGAILTKYSSNLLQESMKHSLVRHVRYADADHASVHAFSGKWYQVDLLHRICTCGRFQYNDISRGHAVAVIQRYRPPPPTPQRNARDYTARNLTVAAMVITYTQVMPPVDVGPLQAPPQPELWECRPPLFKKLRDALRLPALQPESSEHAVLLGLGPYQISSTVYSGAAGAERRATIF